MSGPTLDELRVQARHDRDRLALYRAKLLTGRPTNPARMRELERAAAASEARLRHAQAQPGA